MGRRAIQTCEQETLRRKSSVAETPIYRILEPVNCAWSASFVIDWKYHLPVGNNLGLTEAKVSDIKKGKP